MNHFSDNPYQSPEQPIVRAQVVEAKKNRLLRASVVLVIAVAASMLGLFIANNGLILPGLILFWVAAILAMIVLPIVVILGLYKLLY